MRKILLLIILLMIVSCAKDAETDGPVLARVENSVLGKAEADRLKLAVTNNNYTINDVIASWVDRELLYLAAKHGGLENDETLISQVNLYRKDLLGNAFMNNYIASQISIENSEIKTYYDKYRSSFKRQNSSAKVMHFFTTSDSTAQYIFNILKKPKSSDDRKELLESYNVNITTVEKNNLVERLDLSIFSNNRTNFTLDPIKTDYGYHVIEVLDRYKAGSQINIDEAYDEIYQRLFNQKKALMSINFLDSLRNHYTVKINIENN